MALSRMIRCSNLWYIISFNSIIVITIKKFQP